MTDLDALKLVLTLAMEREATDEDAELFMAQLNAFGLKVSPVTNMDRIKAMTA